MRLRERETGSNRESDEGRKGVKGKREKKKEIGEKEKERKL